jgi:hypothetical protein
MLQTGYGLALTHQFVALAKQSTPFTSGSQRLFPFGSIGSRQIKCTTVVEAGEFKNKAPVLCSEFAIDTFYTYIGWFMVFGMYTDFTV